MIYQIEFYATTNSTLSKSSTCGEMYVAETFLLGFNEEEQFCISCVLCSVTIRNTYRIPT